jgi:hypothetical protein
VLVPQSSLDLPFNNGSRSVDFPGVSRTRHVGPTITAFHRSSSLWNVTARWVDAVVVHGIYREFRDN